ncbi:MAG: hypothetical protein ACRD2G_06165 [Terriglobia bacterium]
MPRWEIEVSHPGLNKSRKITGNDKSAVERKAGEQRLVWQNEWIANIRTIAATAEIEALQTVLTTAIAREGFLPWNSLKRSQPFPVPAPATSISELPPEPRRTDSVARFSWFERLLTSKEVGESCAAEAFAEAYTSWAETKRRFDTERAQLSDWEQRKREHSDVQETWNKLINDMQRLNKPAEEEYSRGSIDFTCPLLEIALRYYSLEAKINLRPVLNCEVETTYLAGGHALVVDCSLPAPADLPSLKEVRYVASRDAFDEIKLRPSEINQLYDSLIYQICLRALHLVFLFDTRAVVKNPVLNGWVTFADPATGNDRRACIISVQTEREAFRAINLERVDPKACFRALKGVGSSQLHGMVPVAPSFRATAKTRALSKASAWPSASRRARTSPRSGGRILSILFERFSNRNSQARAGRCV